MAFAALKHITIPSRPGSARWSVADVNIVVWLFLVAFVLESVLAIRFFAHGLLSYGALFNTDPWKFIPVIAHNEGSPTFRHPLFQTFFSWPVGIVSEIVAPMLSDAPDMVGVRERVVLFMSPLFSGLKAAMLYLIFTTIGLRRWPAVVAASLGVVSFSQVVYGAVPEHFPVSGALLTFVFLYGTLAALDERFNHFVVWLVMGIIVTGVTISNIGIVVIVYAAAQLSHHMRLKTVLVRSFTLGVLAIAVTLTVALSFAGMNWYGVSGTASQEWPTEEFIRHDPGKILKVAAKFPTIVWYSIFGGTPVFYESKVYGKLVVDYDPRLYPAEMMLGVATIALCVGGLLLWWRHSAASGWIALAAIGSVVFNGLLHSVYGGPYDYIVYSQHWHTGLVILVAGYATSSWPIRGVWMGVVVIGVLVCIVGGSNLIGDIFSTIPRTSTTYFTQEAFDL